MKNKRFLKLLVVCILAIAIFAKIYSIDLNIDKTNSIESSDTPISNNSQLSTSEIDNSFSQEAEWIQGQSVKTSTSFVKNYLPFESEADIYYKSSWTLTSSSIYASYYEDGANYSISAEGSSASQPYIRYVANIHLRSVGSININVWGGINDGSVWKEGQIDTKVSVPSHCINREGFIQIRIMAYVYEIMGTYAAYISLSLLNQTNGVFYSFEINSISWNSGVSSGTGARLHIDCFQCQPSAIISNTRSEYLSEYLVQGTTIQHRLIIENPEYSTTISVYQPPNWKFLSINPSCSFTEGSNLVLTDTAPFCYTILFAFNSSKQYLALEDATADYLEDISFEGSWSNDWTNHSTSGWDSISLNSTVIFDGSYSLRLEDTDASNDVLECSDHLVSGEYYISFWYYLESSSANTIRFGWWDDSAENIVYLSEYALNRWHRFVIFVHLKEGAYDFIRFNTYAWQGILFLDDVEIWKVNHEISTSAYEEVTISGTLINWDGYTNPSVGSELINLSLWDRCSGMSYYTTKNTTTDSSGKFSWVLGTSTHNELQDQRENGLNITAYHSESSITNTTSSYFTPLTTNDFLYYYDTDSKNEWDWSEEVTEGEAFQSAINKTFTNGYCSGMMVESLTCDYIGFSSLSIDTNDYTHLYFRIRQNSSEGMICKVFIQAGTFKQILSTYYFYNTWSLFSVDADSDPDWSNTITVFYLYFYDSAWSAFEGDEQIQIDFIRLVKQDTPAIHTASNYAYLSSINDSYAYRIEIDSQLQEYTTDLTSFNLNMSLGVHSINATIYYDFFRECVFLPCALEEISYEVTETVYRNVYLSIVDGVGIGLPFETAFLKINNTRQFSPSFSIIDNSFITVEAFDWFDVKLFEQNYTITKDTEINITVPLYWVSFSNNGSYTAYLEIWRNNKLGLNVTVPPGETMQIRLTSGNYDYKLYYYERDTQATDQKDPSIYSYGRRLLNIGKFSVSAALPIRVDVSTPAEEKPLLEEIVERLTIVSLIVSIVTGILGLSAGYFVTNFFIRRAVGRHAQDPSYVPPREREDWLDKLEKEAGLKTDDEGLW